MERILNLDGLRVLVVEDEYFVATEVAQALREAGAKVAGPCRTEESAQTELQLSSPDFVLLDVNLGPRPSFTLAEAVAREGIPFIFITGIDPKVIPPYFANVPRLVKPISPRKVVEAVEKLRQEKREPSF